MPRRWERQRAVNVKADSADAVRAGGGVKLWVVLEGGGRGCESEGRGVVEGKQEV